VRDVKAGAVGSAFEAHPLAFPADATVVLALLHAVGASARVGDVIAGAVGSAFEAHPLAFPADAAVVLALLYVWHRNGNGEEGGDDDGELHVDGDGSVLLLVLWLLWYESLIGAKTGGEEMEKGRQRRGLYICSASYTAGALLSTPIPGAIGGFKLITVHGILQYLAPSASARPESLISH
jgi:hypothetical protein